MVSAAKHQGSSGLYVVNIQFDSMEHEHTAVDGTFLEHCCTFQVPRCLAVFGSVCPYITELAALSALRKKECGCKLQSIPGFCTPKCHSASVPNDACPQC